METYNNLLREFEKLTEEEKNAILIYKSKLFSIINSVTKIENYKSLSNDYILNKLENRSELENILKEYNDILNLPENMFIKFSIFNSVDLSSLEKFIPYVKKIDELVESAISKISVDEDIVVYRGLVSDSESINLSDGGSIISTSIKFDDAYKFLSTENGKIKHICAINIKGGTNALACPYNIIRSYRDSENAIAYKLNGVPATYLKVSNLDSNGQQEIMLYNNKCAFDELYTKLIGDDEDIYYHVIDVYKKDDYKNHSL